MTLPRVQQAAAGAFVVSALSLSAGPGARFKDAAVDAGLRFDHVNGASGQYHLPEIMGAGGALFDFDDDGDLDALLIQGGRLSGNPSRADATPRLFRNDLRASGSPAAQLTFTDVTDGAGFAHGDYGMGVAVGDYDNDGDADLYLTNYGPNRLYRNEGGGRFTDVTGASGEHLADPRWSASASFADYDADGDLDLFVTNYVDYSVADHKTCSDPTGIRDYCGPLRFRPAPDRLFRNNGDGTFADVTAKARLGTDTGAGLGVSAADFNGDGRQDFYVANDASANRLWLNQGDGTFEDGAPLAGVAFDAEGRPEGSMGIATGDPDNDGDLDLFVTNITGETHAFYENRGPGMFDDRRLPAGLAAITRRFTGFGTDWFDYDRDGRLDLFVANGAVTIIEALRGARFPFRQSNRLIRNLGGRFVDASAEAGSAITTADVGRGAAFGDVDNDGDVDVLVTNNGGRARLLLNETAGAGHWLLVQLRPVEDNRSGIGARVGVVSDDGRSVWRHAHTDGSYLSASDRRVHFGLGGDATPVRIIVEWPRGLREMWTGVKVDRIVTLKQRSGIALATGSEHRQPGSDPADTSR